jgi:hypothetical protein
MEEADRVNTKLREKYRPNRACKLMGYWLLIERHGSKEAKEMLGDKYFNLIKKYIEAAGCSLVEPPGLTDEEKDFLKNFRFQIGSPYVVNAVDMPSRFDFDDDD